MKANTKCGKYKFCVNYTSDTDNKCGECARTHRDLFTLRTADDIEDGYVICKYCGDILPVHGEIFQSRDNPKIGCCFKCYD